MITILLFTLVPLVVSTGCTSQVKQFAAQCGSIKDSSACEIQIACEWLSCFGKDPLFNDQCNNITDEASCANQVACLWGRPLVPHCFAALKDPTLMSKCAAAATDEACRGIIGCEWRLVDDTKQWLAEMRAPQREYARREFPSSVKLSTYDFTGCAHDFAVVPVAELANVAKAWVVKYNLPADAVDILAYEDKQAPDYAFAPQIYDRTGMHFDKGSGTVHLELLISAGRQWNGIDSKAFVYMNTTVSFTASAITAADASTITDYVWDAMVQRMNSTELLLLREEMMQPRGAADKIMQPRGASDVLKNFVL